MKAKHLFSSVTRGDLMALVVVLAAAGLCILPLSRMSFVETDSFEIVVEQRVYGVYSLKTDRDIQVEGPLGTTVVRVRRGKAFVETAPCRDKLCAHMGEISEAGGLIVCAPNRVLIRPLQSSGNAPDAVSR
jgi:hypothetical protein